MKTLWDKFSPDEYVKDNYATVHDEDKEIIHKLVSFYSSLSKINLALEIGVGPNLYPVMAMLPFIEEIECIDFSTPNLEYLKGQLERPDDRWYRFWELYRSLSRKYDIDLVNNLKRKVEMKQGSIYELECNKYDLASMFFCAESVTKKQKQFTLACSRFIKSVKPGGFLVAAFMENSQGYNVGGVEFPAYPVDAKLIIRIFAPETKNLLVTRIPLAKKSLRPGYTGMVFLTASIA
ncbi:hypothetical protein A3A93_04020 [Candidatus Roizmanbacteria bacterium RIFCSPLOWO2_01_FULL_38_12]|uniref:Methyltransferase n=1 Tax=Candidatus Roizmanbacteria bacterium RIFCSPLOWO2_01_FULL_38_12 TaxID=1802061 RepID=A0A1F7ITS9_9BACT|nr:MAG: hypothetical protein A3A93_04020 [Candidatus Roizmanbacteria bacterium RIFCSPLOWO2_01_FULL_38_12]